MEIAANQKGGCRKINTKIESTSRVRKFKTWSHDRPWFNLNFRHENVDNKCNVLCALCLA